MLSNNFELGVHQIKLPQIRNRVKIDKLAKLVSKHGYGVEQEIKKLVESNRIKDLTFKLLFVDQDYNLNVYYKWRTYSYFNNDSKCTWSQLPF